MRRRRLILLLISTILILCTFWIRSYYLRDNAWLAVACLNRGSIGVEIRTGLGSALLAAQLRNDPTGAPATEWLSWHHFSDLVRFAPQVSEEGRGWYGTRLRGGYVVLPYWLLTGAAVACVGWILFWRRRAQLRLIGKNCLVCGYDLRASGDRCPECGTTIPSPLTQAGPS